MPPSRYPLDEEDEAPAAVSRPRVGSRLWEKLDHIEDLIKGQGSTSDEDDPATGPTVTFEPEDLPTNATDLEDEDPDADPGDAPDNGEGTANLAFTPPPAFHFPHRKRVEVPTR